MLILKKETGACARPTALPYPKLRWLRVPIAEPPPGFVIPFPFLFQLSSISLGCHALWWFW